jgi:hypothetical protein
MLNAHWSHCGTTPVVAAKRQGSVAVSQFSAFGTASVKGAIWASKRSPPAVTIW